MIQTFEQWYAQVGCDIVNDYERVRAAFDFGYELRASEPPKSDSFWVIERWEDGRCVGYWDGGSSRNFVTDIHAAVQFRRKADTFWIMHGWHWKDVRAAEHLMLEPEPHKPGGEIPEAPYCDCPGWCLSKDRPKPVRCQGFQLPEGAENG